MAEYYDDETPERCNAECVECKGSGSVFEFQGDGEGLAPCPSCGGLGYELTREDFLRLDALQGDREIENAA
jgi:hypothetical protein